MWLAKFSQKMPQKVLADYVRPFLKPQDACHDFSTPNRNYDSKLIEIRVTNLCGVGLGFCAPPLVGKTLANLTHRAEVQAGKEMFW